MEEAKASEVDRFPYGFDEFSGFNLPRDQKSQAFGDVLKCFLLKVVADGAEKVLKDRRWRKSYFLGNQLGIRSHSLSRENLKNSSPVSKTCQESGICSMEDKMQEKLSSLDGENRRSYPNPSNFNNIKPEITKYEFSTNFPAFLVVLALKSMAFHLNLAITFFTFPIWFSYFLFTLAVFPVHTLGQIKGYLVRKLLTTLEKTMKNVKLRVRRSVMKLGWALVWSGYVWCVLVIMLVLGFVFGGLFMKCVVEEPVMTKGTLHFDYTQKNPVAIVPLSASPSSHRALPYDQKLQVTVSLNVPESEYNQKLGVFQVRVEFLAANGKVAATSSYPCMLRFKSKPIRFVETAINAAPLLAGFQSESQILEIKTNEFKEGLEPTMYLRIILEQRAEYKSGEGIPEVYSALLILESSMARFKRVMWFWRRTVFVWVSFAVFSMELVTVLIFCRSVVMPRGRKQRVLVSTKMASSHLNTISWGR